MFSVVFDYFDSVLVLVDLSETARVFRSKGQDGCA